MNCTIKQIRPGLFYIEDGFSSSQDGSAWAIFEFENAVEVIWFNRNGSSAEPQQDIAEEIAADYYESTGGREIIPLNEINPNLETIMEDDGLMPQGMGQMYGAEPTGEFIQNQQGRPSKQTIAYRRGDNRGQDYYVSPPPPSPPQGYNYQEVPGYRTPMHPQQPHPGSLRGMNMPGFQQPPHGYFPSHPLSGDYSPDYLQYDPPARNFPHPLPVKGMRGINDEEEESGWKKAAKWGGVALFTILLGWGATSK